MSGFRSDIEQLVSRAGEFDDHAGKARRIAEDLRQAIASNGRCWGTDEIGQRFAAAHQAPADQALERIDAMSARLGEMGVKFTETARTYREVDAANAEELDDLGRAAGQG